MHADCDDIRPAERHRNDMDVGRSALVEPQFPGGLIGALVLQRAAWTHPL
jgi:hypothetical protein